MGQYAEALNRVLPHQSILGLSRVERGSVVWLSLAQTPTGASQPSLIGVYGAKRWGFHSGPKSCIHNFVKTIFVSRLSKKERGQSSLAQGLIRDCAGLSCVILPVTRDSIHLQRAGES